MVRFFKLLALAICLLPTLAFGQANICINGGGGNCGATYTGTAIGNGIALTNPLYMTTNANLQFNLPLSFGYWVKTTAVPGTGNVWLLASGLPANTTGFLSFSATGSASDAMGFIQTLQPGAAISPFSCDLPTNTRMCTNNFLVNDGNWHHVCTIWAANLGSVYVDGVLRGTHPGPNTYTPSTGYWQLGFPNTSFTFRDAFVAQTSAITPAQCAEAYNRGVSGLCGGTGCSIAGTDILNNAVSYWPLSNCTGSGTTLACPDSIASNNWGADGTPPTGVAVTVPANGATGVAGIITETATCSDPIGIANGSLLIDGLTLATSFTASPFTVNFNTTWLKDGSHTATATCTNLGGVTTTSAANTFTTSMAIPAPVTS